MLESVAFSPLINNDKTVKYLQTGTVLGFDFGEKRIGIATGEHLLGIAHPLITIDSESNEIRFKQIESIVNEWKPQLLVVGRPTHPDGTPHELTRLSVKFAQRLNGRFNVPVVMVDERYSSQHASQTLSQMGVNAKKQKPMLDAVAAQVILQRYFDNLTEFTHLQSL